MITDSKKYSLQDDMIPFLKRSPYLGHLTVAMRRVDDTKMKADMGISIEKGIVLYYNPDLLIKRSQIHRVAILEHEALHVINRHFQRFEDIISGKSVLEIKDDKTRRTIKNLSKGCLHKLFNYASDIAINQYIDNIPEDGMQPHTFGLPYGLSAEEYFVLLIQSLVQMAESAGGSSEGNGSSDGNEEKGNGKGRGEGKCEGPGSGDGQKGEGSCDNCRKCPLKGSACSDGSLEEMMVGDHSKWQGSQEDRDIANAQVVIAAKECRKRGISPGNLKSIVDELLDPQIAWQSVLRAFPRSKRSENTRRSWLRVNRRLPYKVKGKKRILTTSLVIGVDSSGSVSDRDLAEFSAEIREIAKYCDEVIVIVCDSSIQEVYRFEGEIRPFKGRGGTAFEPVFDYIADKKNRLDPDAVIYLTDGDGEPDLPPFRIAPVLWVVTRNGRTPQAWGRTIFMK